MMRPNEPGNSFVDFNIQRWRRVCPSQLSLSSIRYGTGGILVKNGLITMAGDDDFDLPELAANFLLEAHRLSSQLFLTVIETGLVSFGAFTPDIQGCAAFSVSRDDVKLLFKAAADAHLRELAKAGEQIPNPETMEVPGLYIGIPSGAITLEWTDVELPAVA